jgi:hypothetical protein
MMACLARLFPSRSSYVSEAWLDALANRGSTEGWTEAPRIDWRVNTYTGPRKDPKLPLWPYFNEAEVQQIADCMDTVRDACNGATLPQERKS